VQHSGFATLDRGRTIRRPEPYEEQDGASLPKHGSGHHQSRLVIGFELNPSVSPARFDCTEERQQVVPTFLGEKVDELLTLKGVDRLAENRGGRGVRFDHLSSVALHDESAFRANMEKDSVAGIRLAEATVLEVHRLLRTHQSLLQLGDCAQILTGKDEVLVVGDETTEADRNRTKAIDLLVDLSRPYELATPIQTLEKLPDLAATVRQHRVDPFLANQVRPAGLVLERLAKPDIHDGAGGIEDQGQVGHRPDYAARKRLT
jgi:hypothetical protein